MSYVSLGETRRYLFSTQSASGAATDADSMPTVLVYEQGSLFTAGSPVVSNKATGLYEVAFVLSAVNGFEVGKEYTAAAVAIVGGVTGRIPICSFVVAPAIVRGVTSGSPTTTVIPTNITVANADHHKDAWLLIEDSAAAGALAGESKRIGSMTAGGTITLAAGYAFSAAPPAGVNVRIMNW
jgi:hypothetical protein